MALILLPYLFRKLTKLTQKSKNQKTWNLEKSEVLESFVYHLEVFYINLEKHSENINSHSTHIVMGGKFHDENHNSY